MKEALAELVELVCRDLQGLREDEVLDRVIRREEAVTSLVAEGIAFPHAILEGEVETVITVGVSRDGVSWEGHQGTTNVHVVALLIGSRAHHLGALAELAARLRNRGLYERLIAARTTQDIYEDLLYFEPPVHAARGALGGDITRLTFEHALRLQEEIPNSRLVLHADAISDPAYLRRLVAETPVIVVSSLTSLRGDDAPRPPVENVTIPFQSRRGSTYVQFALLFLLSQGYLEDTEVVINVFGIPDSSYLDSIRITDIAGEFQSPGDLHGLKLPEDLQRPVLTRVLQIAGDLAGEGREGKAVGALFVLGDYQAVRSKSRQLIVNPFRGYPESERNILDPSLEETVKEFAKIDGAFVIRGDGVIASAGTFLAGQPERAEHDSGLGARHAAAQGITAVTEALSVAISESTRKVSVFHRGTRLILT
ncbi:MAG: diadenylate cyclase [Alkalispirochaetaceae bacterium]